MISETDFEGILTMFGKEYRKTATVRAVEMKKPFIVMTLEGIMQGDVGDYLAKGIDGEYWPVKKEIFEKTYEEVKQSAP